MLHNVDSWYGGDEKEEKELWSWGFFWKNKGERRKVPKKQKSKLQFLIASVRFLIAKLFTN